MSTYRNGRERAVEFKVHTQLGAIGSKPSGWVKELNLISWNGGVPKYDIRDWDPSHEHMSRGITLFEEEARTLMELLMRQFEVQPADGRC